MGFRYTHPFRSGALFHLFDFVVGCTLFALHQSSGVGFILQDADDGSCRPFTIGFVGIALFRIGQTVVFLVGQRGENTQPVQLRRDLGSTCALQPHTENITDNAGSVRIGNKLILVILRLHIAIDRERSDKIAVAPLYIQRATGFDGNITAVGFVHYVFYRYGKIIAAAVMGGVDVVGDSDETHTVGREHPAQIAACFDVLAPQAGEVFHDNTVDVAIGDVLHHFLERWTVKNNAAVTIINLFGHNLNIRVALHKVFNEPALIGNAVALAGAVVCVRQTNISCCFEFRHEKALLSPGLLPHEKSGYQVY